MPGSLRERLEAGDRLLGALLRLGNEELVEMVAVSGFDFVLLDFLGDVVCGGFGLPIARDMCQKVIVVGHIPALEADGHGPKKAGRARGSRRYAPML